jgi:hypothetical protein
MHYKVAFLTFITLTGGVMATEPQHWVSAGNLKNRLRYGELPKDGTPQLQTVFLSADDPAKSLLALHDDPEATVKELSAFAGGVSLAKADVEKGVQADGRIALVWEVAGKGKYRRSSAEKDNTYEPDAHRLVAAIAVLDTTAVRAGKWAEGEELSATLPAKWLKSPAEHGWTIEEKLVGGLGVGAAFGGDDATIVGNFSPDPLESFGGRSGINEQVVRFLNKDGNKGAKVVTLMVYLYPDATSRVPNGYRYYVVDDAGKFGRVFTFTCPKPGQYITKSEHLPKKK